MYLAHECIRQRTMYDERSENRRMEQPASRDSRLTYDDFLRFPDDGKRHEIIDGEHYVTPSPNLRHQMLIGRLHFEIELFLRQHPGTGRVFLSPLDVIFTQWDVVEPDLLFVSENQTEILTDNNVQGPPALVVEIMSRGTRKRDRDIKRRLFDRGGVREYWLVDPEHDRVTIWQRHSDGTFPRIAELSSEQHDVLTTRLLPALKIPLVQLFA
jgi:Uma2 family endonuclease